MINGRPESSGKWDLNWAFKDVQTLIEGKEKAFVGMEAKIWDMHRCMFMEQL